MQTKKVQGRATKIVHTAITATNDTSRTQVYFHNTCVVSFGNVEEDEIVLNDGGYRTVTTKLRMNQASNQLKLGYSVSQHKGEWYIHWRGLSYLFSFHIVILDPATGLVIGRTINGGYTSIIPPIDKDPK